MDLYARYDLTTLPGGYAVEKRGARFYPLLLGVGFGPNASYGERADAVAWCHYHHEKMLRKVDRIWRTRYGNLS